MYDLAADGVGLRCTGDFGLGALVEGDVELTLERQGAEVTVWLRDFAAPVDPSVLDRGRDLDDVRPGGLGTHLMKELMDEVDFAESPVGGGNLLRLVKRLS